MAKANPRKVEKVRAILAGATVGAAKVLREMVEGTHEYAHADKATNQLRAASLLVQGHLSMEKAKQEGNGQAVFGVVYVSPRIEDSRQWEAMDPRKGRAIEAVAVPAKGEPDAA